MSPADAAGRGAGLNTDRSSSADVQPCASSPHRPSIAAEEAPGPSGDDPTVPLAPVTTGLPRPCSEPTRAGAGPRGALSRAELSALVARGHEHRVASGWHLFRYGDQLDHVYVIRRGLVALGREVGTRRAVLLLLHEGDIAGDVPLLVGVPAPFDAVAVTDTSFVAIPTPVFLGSLEQSPAFAKRWVLSLGGRLSAWQTRLDGLLAGDLRAQVASLLLQEAATTPTVRLTQQLIADLLGARRTSVNRVLQGLAQDGIVEVRYGQIVVRNCAALSAASQTHPDGDITIDLRDDSHEVDAEEQLG